jgi:hypothetical protein
MSWVKSAIAATSLGVGFVLAGTASAAIVVASSGPSASQFPAGKKLDDAGRITLKSGDSVTVLDQRGTKVLRGPGRFAVSQPGRPLPNPAFAALTRRDAATRARTGAVRTGDEGKPISPNLWYVDVARPGTQCVTAPDAVQLWRGDASKARRYRLTSTAATGAVAFAADDATAPWDTAHAPIADGASYTLAPEGAAPIGSFTFAIVDNPPAEAEDLASVLIAKGCTAQLELLTQTLATARF